MFGFGRPTQLPSAADALPGRQRALPTANTHAISGVPLHPPYPEGSEIAEFALGCFWGEEKLFWEQPGVIAHLRRSWIESEADIADCSSCFVTDSLPPSG